MDPYFDVFLECWVLDKIQKHLKILSLGYESIQIVSHLLLERFFRLFGVLFEIAENLRRFFKNVCELFPGPFDAMVDQIWKGPDCALGR